MLFRKHLKQEYAAEYPALVAAMTSEKLVTYREETKVLAMASSCSEFNACLFMLMTDDTT